MGVIECRRAIIAGQDQFVPPGYQKYDYLETPYNADGYAYIDTDVVGDNNNLVLDFNYKTIERKSYGRILGNWEGDDKSCWRLIQVSGTGASRGYYFTALNRRSGSSPAISAVPTGHDITDTVTHLKMEYGKCTATVGDYTVTVNATADGSAVSTRDISIGTRYPGDTANGCAKGRFYYFFRIFDGVKLIRNYIPVVRKSDSKAGFYDTVNCAFKPSEGTQDFTAGNDT